MTAICKGCGKEFITYGKPHRTRKFCYECKPWFRKHDKYTDELTAKVLAEYEEWQRDFAAGKTVSNVR